MRKGFLSTHEVGWFFLSATLGGFCAFALASAFDACAARFGLLVFVLASALC